MSSPELEEGAEIIKGSRRRILAALAPLAVGLLIASAVSSAERDHVARPIVRPAPNPPAEVKHDLSAPLRTIPPKPSPVRNQHVELKIPVPLGSSAPDPVRQTSQPV